MQQSVVATDAGKKRKEVDIPKKDRNPTQVDVEGKRRRIPVKKGLPSTIEEPAQARELSEQATSEERSESGSEHVQVSREVTGDLKIKKVSSGNPNVSTPTFTEQGDLQGTFEKAQPVGKLQGKQKKSKTPVHERVSQALHTRNGIQKGKPST